MYILKSHKTMYLPIKIERLDIHSNIITVKYSIKAVNWPCCAQPAYKSSYAPACNTFTEQHSVYNNNLLYRILYPVISMST